MSALSDGAFRADHLLDDPDGTHAAAIAALPPLDRERRARIASLARSADHVADKMRAVLRARR